MATNQQPDVNSALADIINRSQWRAQLATDYTETATRLQTAYGRILPNLEASAGGLVDRINQWVTSNPDASLTAEYIQGFKQYQDLLARVQVEMADFSALLRNEAGITQERAITVGANGALEMAQAVSGGMGTVIGTAWNRVSPEALSRLIGYVDSPEFRATTAAFGENAAQNIADVILSSVAQGKGPIAISRILQNWMSLPYSWADSTVRTVQLWSYRQATHENYKANADVVTGWMWWASLDDRTCSACIAMHGTIHSHDEILDGHHQCRCTALPIVRGTNWSETVKTGTQWFDEQSPATQRGILGPGKMDLYLGGQWDWSKATTHYHNDIYGRMRRESTLAEMTG